MGLLYGARARRELAWETEAVGGGRLQGAPPVFQQGVHMSPFQGGFLDHPPLPPRPGLPLSLSHLTFLHLTCLTLCDLLGFTCSLAVFPISVSFAGIGMIVCFVLVPVTAAGT